MTIVDLKTQILKTNNRINDMVLEQDKPSLDLIKKTRDLKRLVNNWTEQTDRIDLVTKEL